MNKSYLSDLMNILMETTSFAKDERINAIGVTMVMANGDVKTRLAHDDGAGIPLYAAAHLLCDAVLGALKSRQHQEVNLAEETPGLRQ